MRRWLRVLLALPVLGAALFWSLALFYLVPGPPWVATSAGAGFALGTVALLLFVRPFRLALGLFAVAFIGLLIWWNGILPAADKDWAPDVARMPRALISGDIVTLHDVRSFDYRSETDYDVRYEDRRYDLSQIVGLDLFMSYWGSPAIAHTILSWEFSNGDHLAISIETRKDKVQVYSSVAGFFKQYELIYVAADERDLVRLRTNYRGENVWLYRLATPPARARQILLQYLETMNEMAEHPRFYNALTENRTTSIRTQVKQVNPDARFDWRILANGYADEMLYEQAAINTSHPFPEIRAQSAIDARAKAADQRPDFSALIREGLPERPAPRAR
jgi:hypothetical protein